MGRLQACVSRRWWEQEEIYLVGLKEGNTASADKEYERGGEEAAQGETTGSI